MVFCELVEHLVEDYGTRLLRVPKEVLDILGIEDQTVVEAISGTRRIGVIACFGTFEGYQAGRPPTAPIDEKSEKDTSDSDRDLPRPRGKPFRGISDINQDEHIYIARLDGEVRHSLGLNIGDLVEIDSTLKPEKAQKCYISVLGRDPQLLTVEERHFVFDQLYQQYPKPLTAGLTIGVNLAFKEEKILIQATEPDGIVIGTKRTNFELNETYVPPLSKKPSIITWEEIGGYKDVTHRIRKIIEIPIRRPEIFNTINVTPPKGILLAGPSGVGKSLVLKALAIESGVKVIEVPSNLFAGVGGTEKNIRELFEKVKVEAQNNPVLLILDNIQSFTPASYLNMPEYIRRFTLQFALGMDTLKMTKAIVIGACHTPDEIDPIMRRPGRFDVEIEMMVPTESERMEIFKILLRTVPLEAEINPEVLKSYVKRMSGYVGADIAAFVKEACMQAVSRYADLYSVWRAQIPPSILRMIRVSQEDFEEAFKSTEPSALKSIHSRIVNPNVKWSDIGGLEDTKRLIKQQLEWQFINPEALEEMGVKPSCGMLLYGPPGNGKTLLAQAVATELQASFISVKGPELLSVWFGESAKIIRELFNRAKKLSPCIIFFDEIDAMVPRRGGDVTEGGKEIDATVNQLLTLLDGMDPNQGIFVMGATNRPGALDLALLRPGRLDRLILIPAPDEKARREILKIHSRKIPIKGDKDDLLTKLAKKTARFSGADLENLCREAALASLREDFNQRVVEISHFEEVLNNLSPSVEPHLEQYYEKFATEIIGARNKEQASKRTITYG